MQVAESPALASAEMWMHEQAQLREQQRQAMDQMHLAVSMVVSFCSTGPACSPSWKPQTCIALGLCWGSYGGPSFGRSRSSFCARYTSMKLLGSVEVHHIGPGSAAMLIVHPHQAS